MQDQKREWPTLELPKRPPEPKTLIRRLMFKYPTIEHGSFTDGPLAEIGLCPTSVFITSVCKILPSIQSHLNM